MDEIIAEKKVEADSQAYRDMKIIESLLLQGKPCLEIISRMESRQEWFFSNMILRKLIPKSDLKLPGRSLDRTVFSVCFGTPPAHGWLTP